MQWRYKGYLRVKAIHKIDVLLKTQKDFHGKNAILKTRIKKTSQEMPDFFRVTRYDPRPTVYRTTKNKPKRDKMTETPKIFAQSTFFLEQQLKETYGNLMNSTNSNFYSPCRTEYNESKLVKGKKSSVSVRTQSPLFKFSQVPQRTCYENFKAISFLRNKTPEQKRSFLNSRNSTNKSKFFNETMLNDNYFSQYMKKERKKRKNEFYSYIEKDQKKKRDDDYTIKRLKINLTKKRMINAETNTETKIPKKIIKFSNQYINYVYKNHN